ncbi:MAG TPA: serine hydrolase [Ornithinibacter sp.]|nr:serine hydrolase [Ornithinibacter sp.]
MSEPLRPRDPRRVDVRRTRRPSPEVIARRRVVVGGGALLGLGALGLGVRELVTADAAASTASATTVTPRSSPVAAASGSPTASPSATPSVATGAAPTVVQAPRLAGRLEEYLSGRSGRLGLELVDLRRGQAFRHEATEGFCYSTIKVLILTTVLRQAQEADVELTTKQRDLAERMVTRSDNGATETLLAQVGRDEVQRVAGLVGMSNTRFDDGWWGFWRTVPSDLSLMVDAVLSSDRVLDGARRTVARFLMADVVSDQRWGVFAPESGTVHVAAKNGWGPLPDGYRLNSTGWVIADDREYVLSILSRSTAGFSHGRRTINEVAGICHAAMADGLA